MNDYTLRKAKDIVTKLDILYGEIEFLINEQLSDDDTFMLGEAQNHIEDAASIIEDVCCVSRFDNPL